ncbi:MAG: DUF2065 domain-containing protein [Thermodesulfobacteriota bacterium]|nr:DUF2065 domain-containing protein [Thermodesulfobacteriota bacterium]
MKYFLCVFGMVLIVEGLPYFAFPQQFKNLIQKLPALPDNLLRIFGFIAMALGLLFIYISKGIEQ